MKLLGLLSFEGHCVFHSDKHISSLQRGVSSKPCSVLLSVTLSGTPRMVVSKSLEHLSSARSGSESGD